MPIKMFVRLKKKQLIILLQLLSNLYIFIFEKLSSRELKSKVIDFSSWHFEF